MKLNRREFLRVTGLTGLLATFGIELPEKKNASNFSGTRHIIPAAEPVAKGPVTWDGKCLSLSPSELIDFSGLANVEIAAYRPHDLFYVGGSSAPFFLSGPARWDVTASVWKDRLGAFGLCIDDLFGLIGKPRRYRFSFPEAPGATRRLAEGECSLESVRSEMGIVTMEFMGIGPLMLTESP